MLQQLDLREMERKSFAVRFQDGILDVYMGVVLIASGLLALLSASLADRWLAFVVYGAVCGLGGAAGWAARKFVSGPRLGTVRLGPAGKRRRGRTMLVMAGSLVFSAILVTATIFWPAISGGQGPLFNSSAQVAALVAVWMLTIFTVVSYIQGFARGYVIGILYAFGLGLGELLNNPAIIMAAGVLIVLLGLGVFIRFVRQNPLPVEGEGNAAV